MVQGQDVHGVRGLVALYGIESPGLTSALAIAERPAKMNASTFEMWSAIPGLVAQAEGDHSVRLIVSTGAGDKAFCAGADISQFGTKRTGEAAVQAYEVAVLAGME
ncbi:hypothetical protein OY671_013080, partial [Metschnikowia pulcherrima]